MNMNVDMPNLNESTQSLIRTTLATNEKSKFFHCVILSANERELNPLQIIQRCCGNNCINNNIPCREFHFEINNNTRLCYFGNVYRNRASLIQCLKFYEEEEEYANAEEFENGMAAVLEQTRECFDLFYENKVGAYDKFIDYCDENGDRQKDVLAIQSILKAVFPFFLALNSRNITVNAFCPYYNCEHFIFCSLAPFKIIFCDGSEFNYDALNFQPENIPAYINYNLPLNFFFDTNLPNYAAHYNTHLGKMEREFVYDYTPINIMHSIAKEVVTSNIWRERIRFNGIYNFEELGSIVLVAKIKLGTNPYQAINDFYANKDAIIEYFCRVFVMVRQWFTNNVGENIPKFRNFFLATSHFFKHYQGIKDCGFHTILNMQPPDLSTGFNIDEDSLNECIDYFLLDVVRSLFNFRQQMLNETIENFAFRGIRMITNRETPVEYIKTFYFENLL